MEENELMMLLTEIYRPTIADSRSKAQVRHKINAILVAHKMFGTNGDSPQTKINQTFDSYIKEYPIK